MKLVKAGGVEIMLYGTSKEMAVRRYNEFQKLLLLEAGIGSDMDAVNRHFHKLHQYIAANMNADATREAENLHFTIYSVLHSLDFRTNTFACLVHSIDGELCTDVTEDGLSRTSKRLQELDITVADLENAIDQIKKKLSDELALYFPQIFAPDDQLHFYAALKQQNQLRAAELLESITPEQKAELRKLDDYFLKLNRPQNFRPEDPENVLVSMDRQFAQMCALMDSNGTTRSEDMPVFDFYARLDYYMSRNKPAQAA